MDRLAPDDARDVARGIAASAAASVLPCPPFAQAAARVVVIGGGFGGASCARALKRLDPKLQVSWSSQIKPLPPARSATMSSPALRSIEAQQFGYDKIAAGGVTVVPQAATAIDAAARTVGLADGTSLPTTGWCCRPASICVSTRCRAMTKPRRRRCRMPGKPASKRCCCASNSRPWTMAAWW